MADQVRWFDTLDENKNSFLHRRIDAVNKRVDELERRFAEFPCSKTASPKERIVPETDPNAGKI